MHISELEANTNDLHEKFEAALAHLEKESEEKDAEIEAANTEIERLGDQVYNLEDQLDQLKEESKRLEEDDAIERERLEGLSALLKEVHFRFVHQLLIRLIPVLAAGDHESAT